MKLKDTRAPTLCVCVCVAPVFSLHTPGLYERDERKLSYDHSAAVALAASRAGERCETKRNCAQEQEPRPSFRQK